MLSVTFWCECLRWASSVSIGLEFSTKWQMNHCWTQYLVFVILIVIINEIYKVFLTAVYRKNIINLHQWSSKVIFCEQYTIRGPKSQAILDRMYMFYWICLLNVWRTEWILEDMRVFSWHKNDCRWIREFKICPGRNLLQCSEAKTTRQLRSFDNTFIKY